MMAAHWEIIAELLKQNRTDVKLIYNTNFSQLKYKQLSILDMWKEFDSVSIGASLDGSGIRGEYIRKETVWKDIVDNRFGNTYVRILRDAGRFESHVTELVDENLQRHAVLQRVGHCLCECIGKTGNR